MKDTLQKDEVKPAKRMSLTAPLSRLFRQKSAELTGSRTPVFPVADNEAAQSTELTNPAFFDASDSVSVSSNPSPRPSPSLRQRPRIPLQRRVCGYEKDLALLRLSDNSNPPSPVITHRRPFHTLSLEDDVVSVSSMMTYASGRSGGSLSDAEETKASPISQRKNGEVLEDGSGENINAEAGVGSEENQGTRSGASLGVGLCTLSVPDIRPHIINSNVHSCSSPCNSIRCRSRVRPPLLQSCKSLVEGPHGKMFTARLYNCVGRHGEVSNVSHVSHVYKGSILVTDLLQSNILLVARSGRVAREFITERGAEPWCACITPRGHVAVTLRRASCVTVWSGHGSLVREFGHGVLKCPTGLACDRKGRFIVTDERTNRVAFFSQTGEFLSFLCSPSKQEEQERLVLREKRGNDASLSDSESDETTDNEEDDGDDEMDDSDFPIKDTDSCSDMDDPPPRSSLVSRKLNSGKKATNAVSEEYNRLPGKSLRDRNLEVNGKSGQHLLDRNKEDDRSSESSSSDRNTPQNITKKNLKSGPPVRRKRITFADEISELESSDTNSVLNKTPGLAFSPSDKPNTNNNNHNNSHEPYEFNLPRYVCVSNHGKILVSDSGSHSVKVFSPDGVYLHSIGSYGSRDGQLKVPYGVCCDQHDKVYVADHYNDRVSVFSLDGTFLQQALTPVSGISRPRSVTVRPAHVRKLYVAHGGLRATEVLVYRLMAGDHGISFKCDL